MFESIFSLSTFVALLLGDKSCEPAPPAKNLTHFFFRLKQRSLWLLMMMWHFYKAHYPYYYTLMCYLALCMDIKFSTLIEICRYPPNVGNFGNKAKPQKQELPSIHFTRCAWVLEHSLLNSTETMYDTGFIVLIGKNETFNQLGLLTNVIGKTAHSP